MQGTRGAFTVEGLEDGFFQAKYNRCIENRIKRKPHQLILLNTRVCKSLRDNTEISLSFERILWEMDSQEAASDAHICLEQKERDFCVFPKVGKSKLFLNFAVPVTCEKTSSSLSLLEAPSRYRMYFVIIQSALCMFTHTSPCNKTLTPDRIDSFEEHMWKLSQNSYKEFIFFSSVLFCYHSVPHTTVAGTSTEDWEFSMQNLLQKSDSGGLTDFLPCNTLDQFGYFLVQAVSHCSKAAEHLSHYSEYYINENSVIIFAFVVVVAVAVHHSFPLRMADVCVLGIEVFFPIYSKEYSLEFGIKKFSLKDLFTQEAHNS
ncbi:hypothetical protein IHE44_0003700 [Lamprotornis superbus]|uniref:Uncharacterized protein n=1 Tax=Lamprotornis superbus TaxID=245042 RepID=A0A835NDZ7_9PASS|nr:hypothetical protein IHE44_0003700 [Lamprotornis superbus]